MQNFLNDSNKAISFEKREITKTYLYLSKEGEVVAYFTISLNVLSTSGISKSTIKKLDGIDKNREEIACFLIAQLGKSNSCSFKIGRYVLNDAIETIKDAKNIIGGRFIILDAINHDRVIEFYAENSFVLVDKDIEKRESVRMYYPLVF